MADGPDVRTRIQMVFTEMPEMRLTRDQVRRLLTLSTDACDRAVSSLLQNGFLVESVDGVLARATSRNAAAFSSQRPYTVM